MLALLGLIAPLVAGQFAQAAGPAPNYGQQLQGSGTIELLNLNQGYIVVDDYKYRIADKVAVYGRNNGTKLSLTKGMRIQFAFEPSTDRGRPVITEIWVGQ